MLDLQVQIRRLPKPVVAMWPATPSAVATSSTWSATSPSPPTTPGSARPGRRWAASTAGYGSSLLARTIGLKRAKEVWFLCRQYDAAQALDWGLVNTVVPLDQLEAETVAWCRRMLSLSPIALRMLKAGFNAADDGLAGVQQLAGDATMLFYMTEEGQEGRNAFVERRPPGLLTLPRASVNGPPAAPPAPGPVRRWVLGARPRTLAAAAVPVVVGTAVGWCPEPTCDDRRWLARLRRAVQADSVPEARVVPG